MIGGLQGEFEDLDIKYLKQNISKCQSQISGSFRRTPQKYLKMSVANIGKLQENTAKISQNVSRKYLEASGEHRGTMQKNISKCRSDISGSFRRTPRHCAKWLQNSPGKRYRRSQICLTGEVETPSFPIRRQAPDAKYPEKVCAGCETSGQNGGGAEFRM